ncbi:hypothetical protein EYR15_06070 [Hansschlegelia quercus]|uniref:Uncharacterized protein n=2 Tax=Hansschlegelia quercus TaxID=2528245 RepID=A0A4Q9GJS9_9HYPH|nr:hypothetical protein EYR15_06070 [Hansschlegelia quercus]
MSQIGGGLLAALISSSALAGAYTLPRGEVKLFVSGLMTDGDRYFDTTGRRQPRGRYTKYDTPVFVEYGVRDGVTLFGSTELEKISAEDGGRHERQGLGRSELGARIRLFNEGPWIASAQGSVVVAGARAKEGVAAIGETDDQVDVRGLIQRSFEAFGIAGFADFEAGYRWRSKAPADEVRLDATVGLRVAPRWLALVQSFNTIGAGRWSGRYPLRQRIAKLQGALFYDLTERMQLFGAAFFTPYGRDAMDETGGQIGVGYRF